MNLSLVFLVISLLNLAKLFSPVGWGFFVFFLRGGGVRSGRGGGGGALFCFSEDENVGMCHQVLTRIAASLCDTKAWCQADFSC